MGNMHNYMVTACVLVVMDIILRCLTPGLQVEDRGAPLPAVAYSLSLPPADKVTPAYSLQKLQQGPTLPYVPRPAPPPEDEMLIGSQPSATINRNFKFTAPRAPQQMSYMRSVPRVATTASGAPAAHVSPAMSPNLAGSRLAFTPQVVSYLKTWLHTRMSQDPSQGIPYLSEDDKTEIAENTSLTVRQITQWFQNRRKDYAASVRSHASYLSTLAQSTDGF
jgi:hypothetical protein